MKSTRELAFSGYSDTLAARYDGRTRQAFVEASYRFGGREAGWNTCSSHVWKWT